MSARTRRKTETFIPRKPCHSGHFERYMSSGVCVVCAKLYAAERHKREREQKRRETNIPSARREAREAGWKTYLGKACPLGHRERYVAGYACVACTVAAAVRRAAEHPDRALEYQANSRRYRMEKAAGSRTYTSATPCRRGHYDRYTTSGTCVMCASFASVRSHAKRRMACEFIEPA